ncbi:MAG TPA: hypothetical protein VGB30_04670 [bacterium]
MNPLKNLSGLMIAIFACAYIGCSGGNPVVNPPDQNDGSALAGSVDNNHTSYGQWHVRINADNLDIQVSTVRSAEAHFNVTGIVKNPAGLKFDNAQKLSENRLSVDVTITHPFPGNENLNGYDVRGIVLGKPVMNFDSGSVSGLLYEPNGYTSMWSYGDYADLNPYMNFATEMKERIFKSGSSHKKNYVLNLPETGALEFDYVIDACWLPAGQIDPGDPSKSPHRNQAYEAGFTTPGAIHIDKGSYLLAGVEIRDWQNDGKLSEVILEIPDLSPAPIAGNFVAEYPNPYYELKLFNELNAESGVYRGLLAVHDQLNNPENDFLTYFQLVEVPVSPETGYPEGIVIQGGNLSLYDQDDQISCEAALINSDGSYTAVDSGLQWDISGTDLNGNELCSFDNGVVTRLSKYYWGGTATLEVQYQSLTGTVPVYCVDPFGDSIDVEFGALNEPGYTFTVPSKALGPPTGSGSGSGTTDVCSLGYGGVATVEFTDNLIFDGDGPDLIVFENGFKVGECDYDGESQLAVWTETAVVEVSQNNHDWVRFPYGYNPSNTTCLGYAYTNPGSFSGVAGTTPTYSHVYSDGTTNGIDPLDPAAAGGVSFDLADVGLSWCRFVRVIDTGHVTYSPDKLIYDPDGDLVTDFGKESGLGATPNAAGFDLDSVAAIHFTGPSVD